MTLYKLCYLFDLAVVSHTLATLQVVNGATWTAENNGSHMQAHGAGVIKVEQTYYLIGEDKTLGATFQNVNCYSSDNLVEWKYENALLSVDPDSNGDLGPNRIVERPKVLFNSATKKYIMYMHIDSGNYGEAKVGVATSDSVCGRYTYVGSFNPMENQSRDIGLFQDDDGSAYLLSEDRPHGVQIYKLSSDYLQVVDTVYTFPEHIEGLAMIKDQGSYYMFGSYLTGWSPNDNSFTSAPSLTGPWTAWQPFAPPGSKTFNSQTNFVLRVSNGLTMYMGDRWNQEQLFRGTYVWLPLQLCNGAVSITGYDRWVVDASAGTWTTGPVETPYEAETAQFSNNAMTQICLGCSGGQNVGNIGGAYSGAVTFPNVTSATAERKTVRILYSNGDSAQRHAAISINGGPKHIVAFLPSAGTQVVAQSSVNLDFVVGTNMIVIEGDGSGGLGPDIDMIMVPASTVPIKRRKLNKPTRHISDCKSPYIRLV